MIALAFFVVVLSGHGNHVAAQAGSTPRTDPAEATSETVDVVSTVILPTGVRLPSRFDPTQEHDLIVALHGFGSTPGNFTDLSPPLTQARLIFAAPQAPTAFLAGESLGFDWDRAHDEPDGSERRVKFGRASVAYVIDVIETLRERYRIRDIYVFGFSQGGAYAYLVGIYHPDRVAGIVAVGMGFDVAWFEDGMIESASAVPVLIAHSPEDRRIPFALAQSSAKTLRELGYDISFYAYPGGHRVTPDVMERMVRWIEEQAEESETSDAESGASGGDTRR